MKYWSRCLKEVWWSVKQIVFLALKYSVCCILSLVRSYIYRRSPSTKSLCGDASVVYVCKRLCPYLTGQVVPDYSLSWPGRNYLFHAGWKLGCLMARTRTAIGFVVFCAALADVSLVGRDKSVLSVNKRVLNCSDGLDLNDPCCR